jgi:signal peptidase I
MTNIRGVIAEVTETFALSFVIIMILYGAVASIEVVSGASMEPNFHTNERILVDKLTPIIDSYRRGDVVVLIPPGEKDIHYIKRVIGLPGETIKIYNCKVYVLINGDKYLIEEDYIPEAVCTTGGTEVKDGRSLKIPENQYLVLGDNRPFSIDSRYIGLVPKDRILGRVIFVLWPIGSAGFLN